MRAILAHFFLSKSHASLSPMARGYDHKKIEKKWQQKWAKQNLYKTPDKAKGKKNFFLLTEFPYPSGNLHVGHWYAFGVPDILARFTRMTGKNVLYPIGFDAFGLPAENAAIKRKLNPRKWTYGNIAYMKKQMASMGASFDWSRQVATCDPEYYKWTQWQFLQFFKNGLAYRKNTPANWCPSCKTVLANEQVVDGKCERCGTEVVRREMMQWNLKITDYADRLVDDLEELDWPEQIKESQRNWIGRSEGAEVDFALEIENDKKYKYVYLHGYKSGADRPRNHWYRKHLEALGHAVVIPELPNTNNPVESEQVQAALDAADFDENTILVGHSLGGIIAMKALLKSGKKIARLVLIAPAMDPKSAAKAPKSNTGRFSGPKPFHKSFNWDFDYEKIQSLTKHRVVLSDLQENARAGYLRELASKLDAQLVETQAADEHFTADKEPDVLMWLRPTIRVFTTRVDTLFGATYLVLAPEHPWVTQALRHKTVLKNNEEVKKYVQQAGKKSDLERQMDNKEKTGVRLEGVEAINPATGEKIPLYVADYALAHYGTGAVMAVPAHDERDHAFAKKFGLPIKQVVARVVRSTSGGDAWREDAPLREREAVMCIVKHWDNDEYLCIQWNEFPDVRAFVSGGIEPGEEPVDTGRREIEEETGYVNPKFVRQVGGFSFVEFYHQFKYSNTRARFRYLYFELKDGKQVPVSEHEQKLHSMLWKKPEEVLDFLSLHEKDTIWHNFQKEESPYTGEGRLVDSGEFDGMPTEGARKKMTDEYGRSKTTYKLRDWGVSRQRYWGVPIPIIHCKTCGEVPVPDKYLPVKLPEIKDYLPEGSGKSPLAKAKKWLHVKCPKCKGKAERETDTLDTFVDSSWYFLRYTDPKNKKAFASSDKLKAWMPINLYSGGAEHTTMHVLYSRFWQKALYDLKLVKDKEPYTRRMNRSLIMGPDGQKMSKSRGNVIDPDEVVTKLGADTVRMYLAFIGPYNEVANYPWSPESVVGVRRFIERVWRLQEKLVDAKKVDADVDRALHAAIKKMTEDIPLQKFNTAIAQMMTFLNEAEKSFVTKKQYETLLQLLAPFAPHVAEELWALLGHKKSIHLEKWPKHDVKKLKTSEIMIVVQVNGKVRAQLTVPADDKEDVIKDKAQQAVTKWIQGTNVARVIYVPGRLVNIVAN